MVIRIRLLLTLLLSLLLGACTSGTTASNSSASVLPAGTTPPATAVAPRIAAFGAAEQVSITAAVAVQPSITSAPTASSTTLPSSTAVPSKTPAPTPTSVPTSTPLVVATVVETPPSADQETHDTAELHADVAPTAAPTAAVASVPVPASEPARLVIEAIGLDAAPVAVGLDENLVPIVPNHDVGWYNLSAMPGQGENVVFWGHVLRFKHAPNVPAPFARLKEAKIGDTVQVFTADGAVHNYIVSEQVWVTPDQVEYILPRGRELVTLVSCIGDKVVVDNSVEMTHRLITIAERLR